MGQRRRVDRGTLGTGVAAARRAARFLAASAYSTLPDFPMASFISIRATSYAMRQASASSVQVPRVKHWDVSSEHHVTAQRPVSSCTARWEFIRARRENCARCRSALSSRCHNRPQATGRQSAFGGQKANVTAVGRPRPIMTGLARAPRLRYVCRHGLKDVYRSAC